MDARFDRRRRTAAAVAIIIYIYIHVEVLDKANEEVRDVRNRADRGHNRSKIARSYQSIGCNTKPNSLLKTPQ